MTTKFRRLLLSILITYSLCFCTGLSSAAKAFETHDITPGQNPAIASDNKGGMHIVFIRDPHKKFDLDICYSQSTNGGSIWTEPVKIAVAGKNFSPNIRTNIAVESEGAIDVVWGQEMYGNIAYIFFVRSIDNGHTWSEPLNISKITHNSDDCNAPALAIGPDNSIHVAWSYTNHPKYQYDESQEKVTVDSDKSFVTAEGTAHIVTVSPGRSFKIITKHPTNPEALINGIYSTSSADGGKMWHRNLPIRNNNAGPSTFNDPDIAVTADGTVHAIWMQVIYGSTDKVYYAHKIGDSWSEPVIVSESIQAGSRPLICASGKEKIYITWADGSVITSHTPSCSIWCTVKDKSEQFSKPINICDSRQVYKLAAAADQTGRAAIVWFGGISDPVQFWIYNFSIRIIANTINNCSDIVDLYTKLPTYGNVDAAISNNKVAIIWDSYNAPLKLILLPLSQDSNLPKAR